MALGNVIFDCTEIYMWLAEAEIYRHISEKLPTWESPHYADRNNTNLQPVSTVTPHSGQYSILKSITFFRWKNEITKRENSVLNVIRGRSFRITDRNKNITSLTNTFWTYLIQCVTSCFNSQILKQLLVEDDLKHFRASDGACESSSSPPKKTDVIEYSKSS
jgi:hypothetical protein